MERANKAGQLHDQWHPLALYRFGSIDLLSHFWPLIHNEKAQDFARLQKQRDLAEKVSWFDGC